MILNLTYRVLTEDGDQLEAFPCEVNVQTGHVTCADFEANEERFLSIFDDYHCVEMDAMEFAVDMTPGVKALRVDQLMQFRMAAAVFIAAQSAGLKVQAAHVVTLADGSEFSLPAVVDLDYSWVGTEALFNPQILAGQIEEEYLVICDIKFEIHRKEDFCAQETLEAEGEIPFISDLYFLKSTLSKICDGKLPFRKCA